MHVFFCKQRSEVLVCFVHLFCLISSINHSTHSGHCCQANLAHQSRPTSTISRSHKISQLIANTTQAVLARVCLSMWNWLWGNRDQPPLPFLGALLGLHRATELFVNLYFLRLLVEAAPLPFGLSLVVLMSTRQIRVVRLLAYATLWELCFASFTEKSRIFAVGLRVASKVIIGQRIPVLWV